MQTGRQTGAMVVGQSCEGIEGGAGTKTDRKEKRENSGNRVKEKTWEQRERER